MLYLSLTLLAFFYLGKGLATDCLKNDDIGPREGNMYECNNPELPRCCEMEQEFTCCESLVENTLRDQLTIWGVILVFVVAVLIVVFCFRKDIYCFESDTLKNSIQSICSFARKRKYKTNPEDDKVDLISRFNGIANLGEPDADEYVRNYLISETCGNHYQGKFSRK